MDIFLGKVASIYFEYGQYLENYQKTLNKEVFDLSYILEMYLKTMFTV